MGARFTATDQALSAGAPRDRQARAHLFRRRLVAAQRRQPNFRRQQRGVRQSRSVLDAVPTQPTSTMRSPGSRGRASRGVAVGAASALPVSIERIAQWAKAAEGRGIVLVPISAVANRAKTGS
jgi:polysaccharide deacetylase 2 family uncharacterized protein YibQ